MYQSVQSKLRPKVGGKFYPKKNKSTQTEKVIYSVETQTQTMPINPELMQSVPNNPGTSHHSITKEEDELHQYTKEED